MQRTWAGGIMIVVGKLTKDRPFLEKVGPSYQGVAVLSPQAFLDALSKADKPAA
jgi:hypothetical protein